MEALLTWRDNRSTKAWWWFLGITTLGLGSALQAQGAICTLSWNANTESELAGYYAFGTASGVPYPTAPAWIGNVTSVTCDQLGTSVSGTTYYFVVKAYDKAGNVSGPSNQVSFTVPLAPSAPSCLRFAGNSGNCKK